jgi:transcription elongation factor GreA
LKFARFRTIIVADSNPHTAEFLRAGFSPVRIFDFKGREIAMASSDKMPMLAEGFEKLTGDLKRLREERPQIIDQIEEARAHGDLSENAEYHAAKERQGQVEASIADIEDKISRAQIIDPTSLSGDKIVFGATVTLLDEDDKPVTYQLVGEAEADAKRGMISYNSPLGRALIGRQVEDEVEVTVPSGDKYYLVEKIEFV